MSRPWLILRLEAPLVSFGGVAIDQKGVTRDFPAASMIVGLIANALGWQRSDRDAHQRLQERLIFATRREREPYIGVFTDTQNAKLEKNDKGWTTRGTPEGRAGASYGAPHRRQRDYHPDALVTVALTLAPVSEPPALDAIAAAIDRPARPLFIGRKPCLPSAPLLSNGQRLMEAKTAHDVLCILEAQDTSSANPMRAMWPASEGPMSGAGVDRVLDIADRRNWISGLHGGTRRIVEGRITPRPGL